jgi:hypothetical protein
MKLYYVPKAPLGARWQGTQVDAKAAGKAVSGDFIQREVPVDKPNLLQFLNAEEQVTRQQEPDQQLDALEQAELRAVAAAGQPTTVSPHAQRDWDASDIEDFILNRASTPDVERIFATLGTRFKELANGR